MNFLRSRAGNDLGHIAFGLLWMAPRLVVLGALVGLAAMLGAPVWVLVVMMLMAIGWAWDAQASYFAGRERRCVEPKLGLDPFNVRDVLSRWDFWHWPRDEKHDLGAPLLGCGICALLLAALVIAWWRV